MGQKESTVWTEEEKTLRLLSWNIDGLDGRDIKARTLRVCELICSKRPHVVYLQEVVSQTLSLLRRELGSHYSVHVSSKPSFQYFAAILITKRCPGVVVVEELGVLDFPCSSMGRHLLQLPIMAWGVPALLLTSHLESLRDNCAERKDQFRISLELMEDRRMVQKDRICIFGGDMNLRDQEVTDVGLPEPVVDVWEYCGSEEEHHYTWDISANDNLVWRYSNKPQLRFDRLYFSPQSSPFVQPAIFQLIGKERISSCGRFPSDHWGMWAEFQIKEITPS